MDFFEQQSSKRVRSNLLLIAFFAALLGIGLVLHFGIAIIARQLGLVPSVFELSAPVMTLIGVCWMAVLAGSFFRFLDVRGGGAVLARRFGAFEADEASRNPQERELLNVVSEMSIAASVPRPDVFVMHHERSINAMVLGITESQRAIIVTQGALDAFDRDELQAVVAHEFGHIVNDDIPLNMRLMIALGGLMALDEVGRLLIGNATLRSLLDRKSGENLHPGMLVGALLRVFGSTGVLFGSLLRSAFSRQREFLADASGIQFTREPFSMASALATVQNANDDQALHITQAPELVHLCFSGGSRTWVHRFFARFLASHPPLQKRIDAIDPHFGVKRRKKKQREEPKVTGSAATTGDTQIPIGPGMAAVASVAVATAAAGEADAIKPKFKPAFKPAFASANSGSDINESGLSDRIFLLLPDERSCLAVLFAMFAPTDALKRREYLDAVTFNFDQRFTDVVAELLRLLPAELQDDRAGIVDHASALLVAGLGVEPRRHILKKLEQLVRALDRETLMNYASLQLIRRKLDVEFPVVVAIASADGGQLAAQGAKVKTFDAMANEFALLLSLMVEASGQPGHRLDQHYSQVLTSYTNRDIPRRTSDEAGIVDEMERAFQTLYVQPRPIRSAFVEHCVEIVMHDGILERRERALLELFAASIGCEGMPLMQAQLRAAA